MSQDSGGRGTSFGKGDAGMWGGVVDHEKGCGVAWWTMRRDEYEAARKKK